MVKRMQRFMVALAVLVALLAVGSIALAQTGTTLGNVEMVGEIEAADAASITVNGVLVDTSAALLRADLTVGNIVKVEGLLLDDGSVQASEVKNVAPGVLPGDMEIVGPLDSLTLDEAVVAGLSFDISTAEVAPGLVEGDMVKVHASLSDTGLWVARELEAATPDDLASLADPAAGMPAGDGEFEIVGTLDEVGDGFIVMAGQTIDTTGAEIKDPLMAGLLVKVHLRVQNGEMVAREVEAARNHFEDDHEDDDFSVPVDCTPTQPAGWTTYTVQSGDTLSSIAHGADAHLSDLALANCIQDARFIVVGQDLFVPQTPDPAFVGNNGDDDGPNHDSNDDHGDDDSNDDSSDDEHADDHSDDHDDDHGGNSGSGGGDDHDNSGHGSDDD